MHRLQICPTKVSIAIGVLPSKVSFFLDKGVFLGSHQILSRLVGSCRVKSSLDSPAVNIERLVICAWLACELDGLTPLVSALGHHFLDVASIVWGTAPEVTHHSIGCSADRVLTDAGQAIVL